MKANEIQVGDWVQSFGVGIHRWDIVDYSIFDERLVKPIPLTAEILEKNGFYETKLRYWIDSRKKPISYHAYGNSTEVFGDALYVHELQHALRLCGLTDLADNFKVD